MTAVWVILGILAVLALLLSCSVVVTVAIRDEVRIWVGGLGIRYPLDLSGEKEKAPVKQKKSKKRSAAPSDKPGKKSGKKSFGETVEFALLLLKSILPPAVKLASHIRFTSVRVDVTVAEDEADRTAIEYGAVSAGIYNLLATLDNLFTLKVKSVDVRPDFVTGEPSYDIFFKAKLRLWHVLAAAVGIFFKIIVHTISGQPVSAPSAETPSHESPAEAK